MNSIKGAHKLRQGNSRNEQ